MNIIGAEFIIMFVFLFLVLKEMKTFEGSLKESWAKALDLRAILTPMAAREPPHCPCGDSNPSLLQDTFAARVEAR